jgi:hypothetical protein
VEAENKPKGNSHPDDGDCCGSRPSCNVKVKLDDSCSNIDEVKEEIKLLVLHLLTTVKNELDLFDLEIIELLDKLKCPDSVDVKVCLKVKCDDKDKCKDDDDDKGHGKGNDHKD